MRRQILILMGLCLMYQYTLAQISEGGKPMRIFGLVKTITTYSVKLKKGWNVWWLSNFVSVPEMRIINEWSTTPNSLLKWYGFEDKWELLD